MESNDQEGPLDTDTPGLMDPFARFFRLGLGINLLCDNINLLARETLACFLISSWSAVLQVDSTLSSPQWLTLRTSSSEMSPPADVIVAVSQCLHQPTLPSLSTCSPFATYFISRAYFRALSSSTSAVLPSPDEVQREDAVAWKEEATGLTSSAAARGF